MTTLELELLEALKLSNAALQQMVTQIPNELIEKQYIDFDLAEIAEQKANEIINKYEGR